MCAPLAVQGLRIGEQPAVAADHCVTRRDTASDRYWDELGPSTGGVDRDYECRGGVGQRVRRMLGRGGCPRRSDERAAAPGAFGQDAGPLAGIPEHILTAKASRPRVLEHHPKARHDLERPEGLNIEQHQQPPLIERCEDVLPYSEGRVSIGDGGQLGADRHRSCDVGAPDWLQVVGNDE